MLNDAKYDCQIITSDDEELNFLYYDKFQPQNTLVPLRPVRQDAGNNPNETRPESGDFFSQGEFAGGGGQQFAHHDGSQPSRFLHEEGFDINNIRKTGRLYDSSLLHQRAVLTNDSASSYSTKPAVANSMMFVGTGDDVHRFTSLSATPVTEDPLAGESPADLVSDLTSDGLRVFAAIGTHGVHVRPISGTWDHWQPDSSTDLDTGTTTKVLWTKERLIVIGNGGRSVYEVVTDSSPAAIETLPAGWVFGDPFDTGPFIFIPCYSESSNRSEIRAYGLNDDASAIEPKGATAMPLGELMKTGVGYVGQVFLGGARVMDNGEIPVFYQAQPDDSGALTYAKVAEGAYTASFNYGVLAMSAFGSSIMLDWTQGASSPYGARYGLAIYHLPTGSFSFYAENEQIESPPGVFEDNNTTVSGIAMFQGRVVWTATSVNYEDLSKYVATATFISSQADWHNAGTKLWQSIDIAYAKPLPASASVAIYYTTQHPEEDDWTLAGTDSTSGSMGARFTLPAPVPSRALAIKIVSTATPAQDDAPEIQSFSVRSDATVGVSDIAWQLQRVVRLLPMDSKGTNPNTPQKPKELRTSLMNLAHQSFTFKEGSDTWVVRMVAPSGDFVPHLVNGDVTLPESSPKDGYLFQLTLEGAKT